MLSSGGCGGGDAKGSSGGKGGAEGAVVVYDPCFGARSAFGGQMAANLRARGCELLGVEAAQDPGGAAARLHRLGWESPPVGRSGKGGEGEGEGGEGAGAAAAAAAAAAAVGAADLRTVWERLLPSEARALASRLEPLDELEEFNLIMSHYFLAVGVKRGGEGKKVLEGFGLASLAELSK